MSSEQGKGGLSLEEVLKRRAEVLEKLRALRKLQRRIQAKPRRVFLRYLSWRFWKFERHWYWRKPKGIDNKMRLQLKGYPPIVKVGYGTPGDIRGLHPSGLKPVVVSSVRDLEGLDPEKHLVYIASTVGLRKKAQILKAAREKGFRVANAGAL